MRKIILPAVLLFLFFSCDQKPEVERELPQKEQGVVEDSVMVVSAHPLATKVGVEVMKAGGNAFDAAIAVNFALAVVYPRAGNLGGGGFAVLRTKEGENNTLDFREKAAIGADRDMYLDENGSVIDGLSLYGGLASGVPGSVEGMIELYDQYGTLRFEELIQPAIDLAERGIVLTEKEASSLNKYKKEFVENNSYEIPFVSESLWEARDTLFQKKIAKTLQEVRDKKRAGFYSGWVAEDIVNTLGLSGGIVSLEDLSNYRSEWRAPITGNFKGYNIISMPPPSSGGIALAQLLQGTEKFDFSKLVHNSAAHIHLMTEIERRVYADRATFLGDPDYEDIPQDDLISFNYNDSRFSDISLESKTPSSQIKEGEVLAIESHETTHFSIVDSKRNAIAVTTTLNGNYGSKVVTKESGFFMNNEMDDFSLKPGVPNAYGLVGGEANSIKSGKRMLSSMTPTIVEKDSELFMVVGTPGGSTIITSVYQAIVNVIDFQMTMQQAVNAKKVHHQWLPDKIYIEKGAISEKTAERLITLGHELHYWDQIGRLDCILVLPDGKLEGAADYTRSDGKALGF
ncbi:MAG: gamma-glutamyltransferase [Bacteroidota bacterium]